MYNALNFWKAGAKQKTIHTRAGSNRPEDLFAGICITGEHLYEGMGYTYFHYFPRQIMALAYLSGYKWSGSRTPGMSGFSSHFLCPQPLGAIAKLFGKRR